MKEIWYAFFAFISIYFLYAILILWRKKGRKNFKNCTEVMYLKKRYQLNVEAIPTKELANKVALANSMVIGITILIVSVIESIVLKIIVAMGVMIPLILIFYHLIGKYYQKKEEKKHV